MSSNILIPLLLEAFNNPKVCAAFKKALASNEEKAIAEPPAVYSTVSQFALRCGFSKRHVENLIRQGMPIVGVGRGRRVPIAQADQWLATSSNKGIEERAKRDAARVVALRAVKP